jgi:Tfp pilus assembly protein PilF
MIRYFIVIVFSALAFAIPTAAQVGHTIRGKVRNTQGEGVAQAIVDLQSGNGARIGQTTTSNEGDFQYSGLTDTSYSVAVSSPDFQPISQDVRFVKSISPGDPGETQYVEIVLRPKVGATPSSAGPIFAQDVPEPARKKYDEALKLLQDKKPDQASKALNEALSLCPEYFDARLTLASELAKGEKLSEAIVELEKARKINPREPRLYQLFGMILLQKQMFEPAVQVLSEAIRLSPKDAQLHYLLGTALIDSVVALDKNKPDQQKKKSVALDEAAKALNTAFDLSGKKMAQAHLQMARVYEKRDDPRRAADELEKYLRSTPNDKNAGAIRAAIAQLRSKT